jgi:hypothetical protein
MRLCFDCLLKEDPQWGNRYRLFWLAILAWGAGAFALPFGPTAIAAQGLFFLFAIGWSVWPLLAARRPTQNSPRAIKRSSRQGSNCT